MYTLDAGARKCPTSSVPVLASSNNTHCALLGPVAVEQPVTTENARSATLDTCATYGMFGTSPDTNNTLSGPADSIPYGASISLHADGLITSAPSSMPS